MTLSTDPDDWPSIDSWWPAYVESQPTALQDGFVLDSDHLADDWRSIDQWWAEHNQSPVGQGGVLSRVVSKERFVDSWLDLDSWWGSYAGAGKETAVELKQLIEQSNEIWEASAAPFDTDPFAADLTLDRDQRGPLQPGGEVSWSRWLAQLVAPAPALVAELFGVEVDQPPEKVIREDQLSKQDGTSRRPDLLILFEDCGVSVEVKLDDKHYEKTAETARLVEEHYPDRAWTHTLLLPKRKVGSLESIVEPPISNSDGTRRIEWDDPGPVTVVYWQDLTAAIRRLLLRGEVVDDHWAANAYLFCTVAEQQLIGFQPYPVVKRMATPGNVVDSIQRIKIADSLGEQLTYLETVSEL